MSNRSTLALALALAAVAPAGCSPGTDEDIGLAASAIEGGALDRRDTGVVGIVLADRNGDPYRMCSGALIGERLVLTAQHCVAETGRRVHCESSVFGEPVAAPHVRVTASARLWTVDTDWVGVADVITPPGAPAVCGRDVALLALRASPLPRGVAPLAPRLDATVETDEPYAAVGFGVTGDEREDAGLRRRRDRLHVLCVGEECATREIAGEEWRGNEGACDGDSGGPALDQGGGVIGVTSRGPAGCEEPVYGAIAPHAGWIREAAARAALEGGYPAPAWAHVEREPETPLFVASGGACSLASGASGGGGALVAVAAVASLALRRRRISCKRRGCGDQGRRPSW